MNERKMGRYEFKRFNVKLMTVFISDGLNECSNGARKDILKSFNFINSVLVINFINSFFKQ